MTIESNVRKFCAERIVGEWQGREKISVEEILDEIEKEEVKYKQVLAKEIIEVYRGGIPHLEYLLQKLDLSEDLKDED